jgi:hypothetical protein
MKSLWMLPLLILLALVTCARVALAEPEDPPVVFCDDTEIFNPDAISGADPAFSLVSYQPAGRDDLMNPFEEPAPSATVTTEASPVDTAGEVVKDVRAGNWREAIAGLVILLMIGLQKVGARAGIFKGDRGGALLVMLVSLLTGISAALAGGAPMTDWKLWLGIVTLAWTAAGAWTWVKKIIAPADADPWGPVWLRKMLGMA